MGERFRVVDNEIYGGTRSLYDGGARITLYQLRQIANDLDAENKRLMEELAYLKVNANKLREQLEKLTGEKMHPFT